MFGINNRHDIELNALRAKEEAIALEAESILESLKTTSRNLEDHWDTEVIAKAYYIVGLNKGREALKAAVADGFQGKMATSSHKRSPKLLTSTLFLGDCWDYLKSDPESKERLVIITGPITSDGARVLDRMERVKMENQSPFYVQGNEVDAHSRIVSLDLKHGHLLHAMFHSHMSTGFGCTAPSGTDIAFMERMSAITDVFIGGIFSLDGFIRFFSLKEFQLDVYGRNVQIIQNRPRRKILRIS